jgi:hypothetical protein
MPSASDARASGRTPRSFAEPSLHDTDAPERLLLSLTDKSLENNRRRDHTARSWIQDRCSVARSGSILGRARARRAAGALDVSCHRSANCGSVAGPLCAVRRHFADRHCSCAQSSGGAQAEQQPSEGPTAAVRAESCTDHPRVVSCAQWRRARPEATWTQGAPARGFPLAHRGEAARLCSSHDGKVELACSRPQP